MLFFSTSAFIAGFSFTAGLAAGFFLSAVGFSFAETAVFPDTFSLTAAGLVSAAADFAGNAAFLTFTALSSAGLFFCAATGSVAGSDLTGSGRIFGLRSGTGIAFTAGSAFAFTAAGVFSGLPSVLAGTGLAARGLLPITGLGSGRRDESSNTGKSGAISSLPALSRPSNTERST